MQGYCVKCRTKREMKNAKSVTTKNGKPATQGVCPVCGTKMYRIGKSGDRVVRLVTKTVDRSLVDRSLLADVPADKVFRCHDGRVMKNLEELGIALREMSGDTFRYHVNDGRNDFSKWVEDVIGDHVLSAELRDCNIRSQAAKVVADRIG